MIQAVNLKQLQSTINKANIPVLIMFRTKWCNMCNVDEIIINKIQEDHKNEFVYCYIDVDENKLWREDNNQYFKIDKVPYYIIYYQKQIIYKGDKPITEYQLSSILESIDKSVNDKDDVNN